MLKTRNNIETSVNVFEEHMKTIKEFVAALMQQNSPKRSCFFLSRYTLICIELVKINRAVKNQTCLSRYSLRCNFRIYILVQIVLNYPENINIKV